MADKYLIEMCPEDPRENAINTYYDTVANLERVIHTSWSKIPHRIVEVKDQHEDLSHIEVRKPVEDGGEILHTFIMTRCETLPTLPDHL
jgi:hypothetical protein